MSQNPLLDRIRAGLDWPSWQSWGSDALPSTPPARDPGPVNAAERAAEVQRRRALARTTDRGGPWLELFDEDIARRLAADADADLGPLADFTFAIKDLIAVAGRRFSAGSPVRADAPPETATAPIVDWLQAQGAVALGTVTMHEFAFGVTGINPALGTAPNPAAPGHCPGGSSSGSGSAVADGSARIAIGTDTGGSVRIPAAFCGVAGFKPAHGTYPAQGVFPLSTTLDHVGFLASDVADLVAVHTALTGDLVSASPPARIAVVAADLAESEPLVRSAVEAAVESIVGHTGAAVIDVDWPDPEQAFVASTGIMFSEAAAIHAELRRTHEARYGDDILARLDLGAALTGPEVAASHRLRRALTEQALRALTRVDVVLSPTVRLEPPPIEGADDPALAGRVVANTRLGNVIGLPAISIPVASPGRPVGLQIIGRTNAAVLGAALAIESLVGP